MMNNLEIPLQFEQVSKCFSQGQHSIDALSNLTFALKPGAITGLLGPDGAGKSTLLRLCARLLFPTQGRVKIFNLDSQIQDDSLNTRIGYMPQRFGLYEDLSVQENLDLYSDLQGLTLDERADKHHELLKLTALGPFSDRRAGALSGGMKQKLGLACALLRTPELLLLDEPTVGVDPIARRELWHIIQSLKQKGVSILLSTAYFDEAERCDDLILIHQGQLLEQKTPDEFRQPLVGRTFVVNSNSNQVSKRILQERLRQRPPIQDARIITEGVRVLCRTTSPPISTNEAWLPIPPSFEDAFIDILGQLELTHTPHGSTTLEITQANSQAVISVRDLTKVFGTFTAVKNTSFEVYQGEVFGLLGANGAGKTTTFRMLCGLLPVTSGTLSLDGVDMQKSSSNARARIGYVSQRFSLYGNLSCDQNLNFFASAYGLRGAVKEQRIRWALEEFQLNNYRQVNTDNLPLGIKQRLALSCALLHEPPILFLDEPTSGVDPLARREFWQRINLLAAQGVTILITTHFMDEAEYCDRLVLMSLGEILAQGTPAEIRQQARIVDHPSPSMEEAFIQLIESHESQIRRAS